MPGRCDVCGIVALENQQFVEERIPFRRTKRYCPACHKKFYHRVFTILAVVPLILACLGIVEAYRRQTKVLDAPLLWFALLSIFQWLMILPDELGHAAAARLLGFTQIRILIGSGRPMITVRLLGIPIMVNVIPFGGITLFKDEGKYERWKRFCTVAAGQIGRAH